jgi:hypothetical protein
MNKFTKVLAASSFIVCILTNAQIKATITSLFQISLVLQNYDFNNRQEICKRNFARISR